MKQNNLNTKEILKTTDENLINLLHNIENELANQQVSQNIIDEIIYIVQNGIDKILSQLTGLLTTEQDKQNKITTFKRK